MHRIVSLTSHVITSTQQQYHHIVPHPVAAAPTNSNDNADEEGGTRVDQSWEFASSSAHRIGAATTAGSTSTPAARKVNQDSCALFFGGAATPRPIISNNKAAASGLFNTAPLYVAVVCDGHGIHGELVSSLCKRLVTSELVATSTTITSTEYYYPSFQHVSARIKSELSAQSMTSGCTCVAVMICENGKMVCFNVGDSRAVGCSAKDKSAVELTIDHKPDHPSELSRIQQAGGRVRRRPGDVPRVAGLALSRAFGDFDATSSGVISQPDVTLYDVQEFQFIVLASDGVYDMMDTGAVVDFVYEGLHVGKLTPVQVAKRLVSTCRQLWLQDTDGRYCDDVTAIVLVFTN